MEPEERLIEQRTGLSRKSMVGEYISRNILNSEAGACERKLKNKTANGQGRKERDGGSKDNDSYMSRVMCLISSRNCRNEGSVYRPRSLTLPLSNGTGKKQNIFYISPR